MRVPLIILIPIVTTGALIAKNTELSPKTAKEKSPVLMKILQTVETATSDERLFDVSLKLLKSLCVCMRETLKVKQMDINDFGGDTNALQVENVEEDSNKRVLELYQNIYNKTCFDLRDDLVGKVKAKTFDDDNGDFLDPNCDKKTVDENTGPYRSSSLLPEIKNDYVQLKYIMFKTFIEMRDNHKFFVKRYNLFSNPSKFSLGRSKHSIIVLLTLNSVNEIYKIRNSTEIKSDELDAILKSQSRVDIDLIDARYGSNENKSFESLIPKAASNCTLKSIYVFVLQNAIEKNIKVFKLLRKKNSIKVYIDIPTEIHHVDYSRICCDDDTKIYYCKIDISKKINSQKVTSPRPKVKKRKKTANYKDTISKIKTLVQLYDKKIQNSKLDTLHMDPQKLTNTDFIHVITKPDYNLKFTEENYHSSAVLATDYNVKRSTLWNVVNILKELHKTSKVPDKSSVTAEKYLSDEITYHTTNGMKNENYYEKTLAPDKNNKLVLNIDRFSIKKPFNHKQTETDTTSSSGYIYNKNSHNTKDYIYEKLLDTVPDISRNEYKVSDLVNFLTTKVHRPRSAKNKYNEPISTKNVETQNGKYTTHFNQISKQHDGNGCLQELNTTDVNIVNETASMKPMEVNSFEPNSLLTADLSETAENFKTVRSSTSNQHNTEGYRNTQYLNTKPNILRNKFTLSDVVNYPSNTIYSTSKYIEPVDVPVSTLEIENQNEKYTIYSNNNPQPIDSYLRVLNTTDINDVSQARSVIFTEKNNIELKPFTYATKNYKENVIGKRTTLPMAFIPQNNLKFPIKTLGDKNITNDISIQITNTDLQSDYFIKSKSINKEANQSRSSVEKAEITKSVIPSTFSKYLAMEQSKNLFQQDENSITTITDIKNKVSDPVTQINPMTNNIGQGNIIHTIKNYQTSPVTPAVTNAITFKKFQEKRTKVNGKNVSNFKTTTLSEISHNKDKIMKNLELIENVSTGNNDKYYYMTESPFIESPDEVDSFTNSHSDYTKKDIMKPNKNLEQSEDVFEYTTIFMNKTNILNEHVTKKMSDSPNITTTKVINHSNTLTTIQFPFNYNVNSELHTSTESVMPREFDVSPQNKDVINENVQKVTTSIKKVYSGNHDTLTFETIPVAALFEKDNEFQQYHPTINTSKKYIPNEIKHILETQTVSGMTDNILSQMNIMTKCVETFANNKDDFVTEHYGSKQVTDLHLTRHERVNANYVSFLDNDNTRDSMISPKKTTATIEEPTDITEEKENSRSFITTGSYTINAHESNTTKTKNTEVKKDYQKDQSTKNPSFNYSTINSRSELTKATTENYHNNAVKNVIKGSVTKVLDGKNGSLSDLFHYSANIQDTLNKKISTDANEVTSTYQVQHYNPGEMIIKEIGKSNSHYITTRTGIEKKYQIDNSSTTPGLNNSALSSKPEVTLKYKKLQVREYKQSDTQVNVTKDSVATELGSQNQPPSTLLDYSSTIKEQLFNTKMTKDTNKGTSSYQVDHNDIYNMVVTKNYSHHLSNTQESNTIITTNTDIEKDFQNGKSSSIPSVNESRTSEFNKAMTTSNSMKYKKFKISYSEQSNIKENVTKGSVTEELRENKNTESREDFESTHNIVSFTDDIITNNNFITKTSLKIIPLKEPIKIKGKKINENMEKNHLHYIPKINKVHDMNITYMLNHENNNENFEEHTNVENIYLELKSLETSEPNVIKENFIQSDNSETSTVNFINKKPSESEKHLNLNKDDNSSPSNDDRSHSIDMNIMESGMTLTNTTSNTESYYNSITNTNYQLSTSEIGVKINNQRPINAKNKENPVIETDDNIEQNYKQNFIITNSKLPSKLDEIVSELKSMISVEPISINEIEPFKIVENETVTFNFNEINPELDMALLTPEIYNHTINSDGIFSPTIVKIEPKLVTSSGALIQGHSNKLESYEITKKVDGNTTNTDHFEKDRIVIHSTTYSLETPGNLKVKQMLNRIKTSFYNDRADMIITDDQFKQNETVIPSTTYFPIPDDSKVLQKLNKIKTSFYDDLNDTQSSDNLEENMTVIPSSTNSPSRPDDFRVLQMMKTIKSSFRDDRGDSQSTKHFKEDITVIPITETSANTPDDLKVLQMLNRIKSSFHDDVADSHSIDGQYKQNETVIPSTKKIPIPDESKVFQMLNRIKTSFYDDLTIIPNTTNIPNMQDDLNLLQMLSTIKSSFYDDRADFRSIDHFKEDTTDIPNAINIPFPNMQYDFSSFHDARDDAHSTDHFKEDITVIPRPSIANSPSTPDDLKMLKMLNRIKSSFHDDRSDTYTTSLLKEDGTVIPSITNSSNTPDDLQLWQMLNKIKNSFHADRTDFDTIESNLKDNISLPQYRFTKPQNNTMLKDENLHKPNKSKENEDYDGKFDLTQTTTMPENFILGQPTRINSESTKTSSRVVENTETDTESLNLDLNILSYNLKDGVKSTLQSYSTDVATKFGQNELTTILPIEMLTHHPSTFHVYFKNTDSHKTTRNDKITDEESSNFKAQAKTEIENNLNSKNSSMFTTETLPNILKAEDNYDTTQIPQEYIDYSTIVISVKNSTFLSNFNIHIKSTNNILEATISGYNKTLNSKKFTMNSYQNKNSNSYTHKDKNKHEPRSVNGKNNRNVNWVTRQQPNFIEINEALQSLDNNVKFATKSNLNTGSKPSLQIVTNEDKNENTQFTKQFIKNNVWSTEPIYKLQTSTDNKINYVLKEDVEMPMSNTKPGNTAAFQLKPSSLYITDLSPLYVQNNLQNVPYLYREEMNDETNKNTASLNVQNNSNSTETPMNFDDAVRPQKILQNLTTIFMTKKNNKKSPSTHHVLSREVTKVLGENVNRSNPKISKGRNDANNKNKLFFKANLPSTNSQLLKNDNIIFDDKSNSRDDTSELFITTTVLDVHDNFEETLDSTSKSPIIDLKHMNDSDVSMHKNEIESKVKDMLHIDKWSSIEVNDKIEVLNNNSSLKNSSIMTTLDKNTNLVEIKTVTIADVNHGMDFPNITPKISSIFETNETIEMKGFFPTVPNFTIPVTDFSKNKSQTNARPKKYMEHSETKFKNVVYNNDNNSAPDITTGSVVTNFENKLSAEHDMDLQSRNIGLSLNSEKSNLILDRITGGKKNYNYLEYNKITTKKQSVTSLEMNNHSDIMNNIILATGTDIVTKLNDGTLINASSSTENALYEFNDQVELNKTISPLDILNTFLTRSDQNTTITKNKATTVNANVNSNEDINKISNIDSELKIKNNDNKKFNLIALDKNFTNTYIIDIFSTKETSGFNFNSILPVYTGNINRSIDFAAKLTTNENGGSEFSKNDLTSEKNTLSEMKYKTNYSIDITTDLGNKVYNEIYSNMSVLTEKNTPYEFFDKTTKFKQYNDTKNEMLPKIEAATVNTNYITYPNYDMNTPNEYKNEISNIDFEFKSNRNYSSKMNITVFDKKITNPNLTDILMTKETSDLLIYSVLPVYVENINGTLNMVPKHTTNVDDDTEFIESAVRSEIKSSPEMKYKTNDYYYITTDSGNKVYNDTYPNNSVLPDENTPYQFSNNTKVNNTEIFEDVSPPNYTEIYSTDQVKDIDLSTVLPGNEVLIQSYNNNNNNRKPTLHAQLNTANYSATELNTNNSSKKNENENIKRITKEINDNFNDTLHFTTKYTKNIDPNSPSMIPNEKTSEFNDKTKYDKTKAIEEATDTDKAVQTEIHKDVFIDNNNMGTAKDTSTKISFENYFNVTMISELNLSNELISDTSGSDQEYSIVHDNYTSRTNSLDTTTEFKSTANDLKNTDAHIEFEQLTTSTNSFSLYDTTVMKKNDDENDDLNNKLSTELTITDSNFTNTHFEIVSDIRTSIDTSSLPRNLFNEHKLSTINKSNVNIIQTTSKNEHIAINDSYIKSTSPMSNENNVNTVMLSPTEKRINTDLLEANTNSGTNLNNTVDDIHYEHKRGTDHTPKNFILNEGYSFGQSSSEKPKKIIVLKMEGIETTERTMDRHLTKMGFNKNENGNYSVFDTIIDNRLVTLSIMNEINNQNVEKNEPELNITNSQSFFVDPKFININDTFLNVADLTALNDNASYQLSPDLSKKNPISNHDAIFDFYPSPALSTYNNPINPNDSIGTNQQYNIDQHTIIHDNYENTTEDIINKNDYTTTTSAPFLVNYNNNTKNEDVIRVKKTNTLENIKTTVAYDTIDMVKPDIYSISLLDNNNKTKEFILANKQKNTKAKALSDEIIQTEHLLPTSITIPSTENRNPVVKYLKDTFVKLKPKKYKSSEEPELNVLKNHRLEKLKQSDNFKTTRNISNALSERQNQGAFVKVCVNEDNCNTTKISNIQKEYKLKNRLDHSSGNSKNKKQIFNHSKLIKKIKLNGVDKEITHRNISITTNISLIHTYTNNVKKLKGMANLKKSERQTVNRIHKMSSRRHVSKLNISNLFQSKDVHVTTYPLTKTTKEIVYNTYRPTTEEEIDPPTLDKILSTLPILTKKLKKERHEFKYNMKQVIHNTKVKNLIPFQSKIQNNGANEGKLSNSGEKTRLYPVNNPQKPQKTVMKKINVGNRKSDIIQMNTDDFFSRRRAIDRGDKLYNILRLHPKSEKIHQVTKLPRHVILRPIFKTIKSYKNTILNVKPVIIQETDHDFYREMQPRGPLKQDKPQPYTRLSFIDPVLEKPYYVPAKARPKFLRDKVDAIRSFIYNSELSTPRKHFLNPPTNLRDYADPLIYDSEANWRDEEVDTSSQFPMTRPKKTIFFLSPTVPYNRYF